MMIGSLSQGIEMKVRPAVEGRPVVASREPKELSTAIDKGAVSHCHD
jgi:hypothetical protein